MSALISLLIKLLPLLLQLFGVGAVALAGNNYCSLAVSDPELGFSSPTSLYYVSGPAASALALFASAFGIKSLQTQSVASIQSWIDFATKLVAFLKDNPQLSELITDLIRLLQGNGMAKQASHLESALRASRAGK